MFWRLKAIKFPFKRIKDEQQIVIDVKSVETAKERIKAAIEPAQVKKSDVNVTAKKQASESVDVIEVSGKRIIYQWKMTGTTLQSQKQKKLGNRGWIWNNIISLIKMKL